MEEEKELFAKQIHLPKEIKADLEVQAIREGWGDLKNMIQSKTIQGLKDWREETKD